MSQSALAEEARDLLERFMTRALVMEIAIRRGEISREVVRGLEGEVGDYFKGCGDFFDTVSRFADAVEEGRFDLPSRS